MTVDVQIIEPRYNDSNYSARLERYMSDENKQEDLPEWITTDKAAEITGLKRDTIAEYCRRYRDGTDKRLVCKKMGRDWWVSSASALKLETTNRGRPRIETDD